MGVALVSRNSWLKVVIDAFLIALSYFVALAIRFEFNSTSTPIA